MFLVVTLLLFSVQISSSAPFGFFSFLDRIIFQDEYLDVGSPCRTTNFRRGVCVMPDRCNVPIGSLFSGNPSICFFHQHRIPVICCPNSKVIWDVSEPNYYGTPLWTTRPPGVGNMTIKTNTTRTPDGITTTTVITTTTTTTTTITTTTTTSNAAKDDTTQNDLLPPSTERSTTTNSFDNKVGLTSSTEIPMIQRPGFVDLTNAFNLTSTIEPPDADVSSKFDTPQNKVNQTDEMPKPIIDSIVDVVESSEETSNITDSSTTKRPLLFTEPTFMIDLMNVGIVSNNTEPPVAVVEEEIEEPEDLQEVIMPTSTKKPIVFHTIAIIANETKNTLPEVPTNTVDLDDRLEDSSDDPVMPPSSRKPIVFDPPLFTSPSPPTTSTESLNPVDKPDYNNDNQNYDDGSEYDDQAGEGDYEEETGSVDAQSDTNSQSDSMEPSRRPLIFDIPIFVKPSLDDQSNSTDKTETNSFSEVNDLTDSSIITDTTNVMQQPSDLESEKRPETTNNEDTSRVAAQMCKEYSQNYSSTSRNSSLLMNEMSSYPGEFPHMAQIGIMYDADYYDDATEAGYTLFFCGGSLISAKFVLTAAHCFTKQSATIVRLGQYDVSSSDLSPEVQDFAIEDVMVHPKYRSTSTYNDIALIELKETVTFTDFIRPACLSYDEETDGPGLATTGWGHTAFSGQEESSFLQKIPMVILPEKECNVTLTRSKIEEGIKDTQICAGTNSTTQTTCQGDSGGPLSYYIFRPRNSLKIYYIVGVTSYGEKCDSKSPTLYTRVYSYLDWIEGIVWK